MVYWGKMAASILGWPLQVGIPVGDVDEVFIVGHYDPPYYVTTLKCTQRAKRKIAMWNGTDAALLQDASILYDAEFVADSQDIRDILLTKGIDAPVVMFPTPNHFPVTPLPEEPMVSVYLGSDPDKYGVNMVFALMDHMKDVKFQTYMFGNHGPEEMADICRETSVYLRLKRPGTDGGCASAREFMEAGRRAVIAAGHFPHARQVQADDLLGIAKELRRALKFTEPDLEAAAYYAQFNSAERWLSDLREVGVLHG